MVCPRCGECATITNRVLCPSCAYVRELNPRHISYSLKLGVYQDYPLWLKISCAGGMLYAFNYEHLTWLENYVRATLREKRRNPYTGWFHQAASTRLPLWIKSAKNRREILHGIEKLKQMAKS